MQTTKFTRRLRALLMVGAVAAVTAGAVATPALADGNWHSHDGWRGHEWHQRAWRDDDDREGPAYYRYGYYSYPYAYVAPAPVYAAPPSVGFYFGIR
jgi:hypothetical protein